MADRPGFSGVNQLLSVGERGIAWILALDLGDGLLAPRLFWRCSCLRPPRFVTTYSHLSPRLTQREQEGFSLWHFTLDEAQEWQLSRSFGADGVVEWRAAGAGDCGAGRPTAVGDTKLVVVAMVNASAGKECSRL